MHQADSGGLGLDRFRSASGILFGTCKAFAAPWEGIFRGNFGPRYFGLHAAATILLIPFWTLVWPQEDCRLLLSLVFVQLGLCVTARLGILWRGLRSRSEHSHYNGTSRLARIFPRLSEHSTKALLEPLLAFIASVLLLAVDRPLGSFLLMGAFGLFASTAVVDAYQRRRVADLHDAWMEQRHLAEGFRRMRGE